MSIRQRIQQYVSYQRTVRELTKLDSRELSGLGIGRADIAALARGQIK